jgi:hypothetical protein
VALAAPPAAADGVVVVGAALLVVAVVALTGPFLPLGGRDIDDDVTAAGDATNPIKEQTFQ